jgi:hypothetical protein
MGIMHCSEVGRTVLTDLLEGYFNSTANVSALNYDVRAFATCSHLHSFDPKGTYSNSGMLSVSHNFFF